MSEAHSGGGDSARTAKRVAAVIFALLVVASVGAFFVAQRLKQEPSVARSTKRIVVISPSGDRVRDKAYLTYTLSRGDDVTAAIVNSDGDVVRTLSRNSSVKADSRQLLVWNGEDEQGKPVPDGRYKLRLGLRNQGRSVTLPTSIRVDTAAPQPQVAAIGPERDRGPEIFPPKVGAGDTLTVRYRGPQNRGHEFIVYRTDLNRPRREGTIKRPAGETNFQFDGTINGRKLPPGTYSIAVVTRDEAGNRGSGPVKLPPRAGDVVAGSPGFEVRPLAVVAPVVPVAAKSVVKFGVDSRGASYRWSVRRLGSAKRISEGLSNKGTLAVRAPDGASGVYLLDVRTRSAKVQTPFAVDAKQREDVLVVLPTATWQGRNRIDDNGDGLPDTLDAGTQVRLDRHYALGGMPVGFNESEAPLLRYLDREKKHYDITTDIALARGQGPPLRGHSGVLVTGDMRWMPGKLDEALRKFVQQGKTFSSPGVDSLLRTVQVQPRRLVSPSAPAATDIFGSKLAPLVRRPIEILALPGDKIGLFAGTDGLITGFSLYEQTLQLGSDSRRLAAGGPKAGTVVVVAFRYKKQGTVIRTGLPQWNSRITREPNVAQVTNRIWTLLTH